MEESRIEELKRLISESNEKIEKSKRRLEEIDYEMDMVNQQIEEEQLNQFKQNPPKILTKSQMNLLKSEQEKDLKRKKEQEIKDVDINTKRAFEIAQNIRRQSQNLSEEQRKSANKEALQLEIEALRKELEIRKIVCRKSSQVAQDALAQKISDEVKFIQNKKQFDDQIQKNGKANEILRKNLAMFQNNKNRALEIYLKSFKALLESESKFFKTEKRLKFYTDKIDF